MNRHEITDGKPAYDAAAHWVIYPILILFLFNSYHLSVNELARLVLLGAAFYWMAVREGKWYDRTVALAPLLVVFCAAQFDPQSGQIPSVALDIGPGVYRIIFFILVFAQTALLVLSRFKKPPSIKNFARLDKWAVWSGISAIIAYSVSSLTLSNRVPGQILTVDLLFFSYIALYISTRQVFLEPLRVKKFVRSLMILFALTALVVISRLSLSTYLYNTGESLLKEGDYHGACVVLKMAGKLNRTLAVKALDIKVHYNLGLCYLSEKNNEAAFREIGEVLAMDPHYASGLKLMGMYYVSQRDWENAVKYFEEVHKIDKSDTSYFPSLALAYAHLEYTERGRFLSQYQGNLGSVHGWYNGLILSVALNKWKRYDEARKLAENAVLRVSPSLLYLAYTELGLALEGKKMTGEAEANYRKAIRLAPTKSFVAYTRLEKLCSISGRKGEAKKMKEAAVGIGTRQLKMDDLNVQQLARKDGETLSFLPHGSANARANLYRGKYELQLTAMSDPVCAVPPQVSARLGDKTVGELIVPGSSWTTYKIPVVIYDADSYKLEVKLMNKCSDNEGRPALSLKDISFNRVSDE